MATYTQHYAYETIGGPQGGSTFSSRGPKRQDVNLDAETAAVGATLTFQRDPVVTLPLAEVLRVPEVHEATGEILFRGPVDKVPRSETPLIDLLHPAAKQLCRKDGSHHSTLGTLLDAVTGFGVSVTTACGRRYHGLLASVEDADLSVVIEECVQEKRGGQGEHKGVMIIPGSNVLSIELVTPEPVPLFNPCPETDDGFSSPPVSGHQLPYSSPPAASSAPPGAHMTILLKGYHTWPFPDAASAAASSPAAPDCVRFLTDLRAGIVPRPVSLTLDGAPTASSSANVFFWTKHHHGHTMVLNGLVSKSGKRKEGKGGAHNPAGGPFR